MKLILFFIFCTWVQLSICQVVVSPTPSTGDISSILDIQSSNKGMMVPRMSLSDRDMITSPAHSLLIYQTDNTPGYYYNAGTPVAPQWTMLESNQSLLLKLGRTPISSIPFTISQPGSYYLTQNLSGTSGITISASNVHIDLNGNALSGTAGNTVAGIGYSGTISNITITNGFITNWGKEGINLSASSAVSLSDIVVSGNGLDGIYSGNKTIVTRIIAHDNGSDGIDLGESSTIENSVAEDNVNDGIELDHGGIIKNCVAKSNMGIGFRTTNFAVLTECTSQSNTSHGFSTGTGSNIYKCNAKSNGQNGFFILSSSQLGDNVSNLNSTNGYQISGNDCILKNNHAQGNTLSGFLTTFNRNQFIENTANFNSAHGFNISGSGSLLIRNTAGSNTTGAFTVSAGNITGTVLTSATINSNTNPNANISF